MRWLSNDSMKFFALLDSNFISWLEYTFMHTYISMCLCVWSKRARWCGSSSNYSNIWTVSRKRERERLRQKNCSFVRSFFHLCSLCMNKRFVVVAFVWWHTYVSIYFLHLLCICVCLLSRQFILRCLACLHVQNTKTATHEWNTKSWVFG